MISAMVRPRSSAGEVACRWKSNAAAFTNLGSATMSVGPITDLELFEPKCRLFSTTNPGPAAVTATCDTSLFAAILFRMITRLASLLATMNPPPQPFPIEVLLTMVMSSIIW